MLLNSLWLKFVKTTKTNNNNQIIDKNKTMLTWFWYHPVIPAPFPHLLGISTTPACGMVHIKDPLKWLQWVSSIAIRVVRYLMADAI